MPLQTRAGLLGAQAARAGFERLQRSLPAPGVPLGCIHGSILQARGSVAIVEVRRIASVVRRGVPRPAAATARAARAPPVGSRAAGATPARCPARARRAM